MGPSFSSANLPTAATPHIRVRSAWEKAIEGAGEAKLQKWASTIAHIGAHNAYHVGQMIYVRKLQGSWDPDKGVR